MSVIPEGYTELAVTGYSNMGNEYDPEKTYYKYNTVYYDGSTYVIVKDGIQGITPTNDGENYRFFAKGFPGDAESVTADDKYDITQEEQDPSGVSVRKTPLQTWIDHAANFIVNKMVHTDAFQNILKKYLANNGTTNQEGFALDARFGKTLQDQVTELDSKSSKKNYTSQQPENVDPVHVGSDIYWSVFHADSLMIAVSTFKLSQIPITIQDGSLYHSPWYYINSTFPEQFAGPPQVFVCVQNQNEAIILPRLVQEWTKEWFGALEFFSNKSITEDLNVFVTCVGTNIAGDVP